MDWDFSKVNAEYLIQARDLARSNPRAAAMLLGLSDDLVQLLSEIIPREVALITQFKPPLIAPRLDITHVAFVPDLIKSNLWMERDCATCHMSFPVPRDSTRLLCPGCRLTQSFRCSTCGTARSGYRKGRRKTTCPVCGWRHLQ